MTTFANVLKSIVLNFGGIAGTEKIRIDTNQDLRNRLLTS